MRQVLKVGGGSRSYPVLCGHDPVAGLQRVFDPRWRQVAVIGDSNTLPLYGRPLLEPLRTLAEEVVELCFPAGEAHKTRATKEELEDQLLARRFERSCCVVAVGGGVALDLAGFVAATYLRGVAHVCVATSLLAQVDASVGGKTAVDTPHGKNLVGAFHPPRAVLLHLGALDTLPPAELSNGLAEALKHGVVGDPTLLDALDAWAGSAAPAPRTVPEDLLVRCVAVKAGVVAEDEREGGRRRVLNFGHTVAHAIEAASGHAVSHGAAVAAGMVVEARVAERLLGFDSRHTGRLITLLERLGLPTAPQRSFAQARAYLGSDKKVAGGRVRCSLPTDLGRMDPAGGQWARDVPLALLEQVWEETPTGRTASLPAPAGAQR